MDRELSEVLSEYRNIRECKSIVPISSGTANRSYLAVCKGDCQAESLKYVIRKRNPKYSSELWIQYESEYLEHVSYKGIPVPVPLRNSRGGDCCRINESVYQVYPFLGGGSFNCRSIEDISEGGSFLGRLHEAVKDFKPKCDKPLPRYDDPLAALEALSKYLKEHEESLSNREKEILEYVLNQTVQVSDYLPDMEYDRLPQLVIHGDYHPANVKYEKGRICGLFDFDWISAQPRLRDIIDGLIYFSSIRSENIAGGDIFSLTGGYRLDIERSRAFLGSYRKASGQQLTDGEIGSIPYFIRARLICSRVQALSKIPAERAAEMLTRDISEPLLWLDANQEKLIAALRPKKAELRQDREVQL